MTDDAPPGPDPDASRNDRPDRRRFLTILAVTSAAALTGCAGPGPSTLPDGSSAQAGPTTSGGRAPHRRSPHHASGGTQTPTPRPAGSQDSGAATAPNQPSASSVQPSGGGSQPSHAPTSQPSHQPTSRPTRRPTPSASASQPPGMGALVATADVPVGGGVVVHPAGVVVTQPTAGEFHGFSGRCTHAGCPIRSVAAGLIQCPCHGSRFAIVDGSVVHGPAVKPLPPFAIRVADGYVYPA